MSSLRQEIIETQKTRSDFLKWKLIGVAALGAAGLGLSQPPQTDPTRAFAGYMLLPLIPAVCVYVDLLCRHLSLRILVIGAFLRSHDIAEQRSYEQFVKDVARRSPKRNIFVLEDWALEWSTMFLSLLVVIVGRFPRLLVKSGTIDPVFAWFAILSGALAIVLSWVFRWHYKKRSDDLDRIEPDSAERRAA